jgi:hypothetical protein
MLLTGSSARAAGDVGDDLRPFSRALRIRFRSGEELRRAIRNQLLEDERC